MGQQSIKHVPLPIFGNVHGLGRTMDHMQQQSLSRADRAFSESTLGKKIGFKPLEMHVKQDIAVAIKNMDNDATKPAAYGQARSAIEGVKNSGIKYAQAKDELKELATKMDKLTPTERQKYVSANNLDLDGIQLQQWRSGGTTFTSLLTKVSSDSDMSNLLAQFSTKKTTNDDDQTMKKDKVNKEESDIDKGNQ